MVPEKAGEVAHTGKASLLVDRMERGGPLQVFAIRPGLITGQAYYYTPLDTSKGTISMGLQFRNARGEQLFSCSSGSTTLADTAGRWASFELFGEVPSEIDGQELVEARLVITVDNAQDTQVYLDDVAVFQFAFQEAGAPATDAVQRVAAPNLLSNHGFEEVQDSVPAAWTIPSAQRDDGAIASMPTAARTGSQGLRIANDTTAYHMIWQDVPVEAGATYELAAWVKGSAHAVANLYVEFYSQPGRAGYLKGTGVDFRGLPPSWDEIKTRIEAPAGATFARAYLRMKGSGEVYFDDVSLRRLPEG